MITEWLAHRLDNAHLDLRASMGNGGREHFKDEPRTGESSNAVTQNNVQVLEKLIGENLRITYLELEKELATRSAAIQTTIHDRVSLHKLCSKRVPHTLTDEQKDRRVDRYPFMTDKLDGRKKESLGVTKDRSQEFGIFFGNTTTPRRARPLEHLIFYIRKCVHPTSPTTLLCLRSSPRIPAALKIKRLFDRETLTRPNLTYDCHVTRVGADNEGGLFKFVLILFMENVKCRPKARRPSAAAPAPPHHARRVHQHLDPVPSMYPKLIPNADSVAAMATSVLSGPQLALDQRGGVQSYCGRVSNKFVAPRPADSVRPTSILIFLRRTYRTILFPCRTDKSGAPPSTLTQLLSTASNSDTGHNLDSNFGLTVDFGLGSVLGFEPSRPRLSILLLVPFAISISLAVTGLEKAEVNISIKADEAKAKC
ncbi:hypothetical protein EVAR_80568_1 [Eumeta japonica]|uniref:Uncharacterized protein n=1 Tax=Eumeta variegata TaxID=151549 RepID=A0A4C1TMS2_EUMVA|nr:hypothetical protein EVAR_80568_1 [Eumeta japonica]